MRILVTPNQLRTLSCQLQQAAEQLRALDTRLGHAVGGLSWEARSRANIDGRAGDARQRARHLASDADDSARFLAERAQAFEQADSQGVAGIRSVDRSFVRIIEAWMKGPAEVYRFPMQKVAMLAGLGWLAPFAPGAIAGVGAHVGQLRETIGEVQVQLDTLASEAVPKLDRSVQSFLDSNIPLPSPGGKETFVLDVDSGITFASGYVAPGGTVAISRNSDGTYDVRTASELEGGARSGVGGKIIYGIDGVKSGIAISGGGKLGGRGQTAQTYRFDPNVPGDMTRLAGLLATLGAHPFVPGTGGVASKACSGNLRSTEGDFGGAGSAGFDAVIGEGLGGSGAVRQMTGFETRVNDLGQTEKAYSELLVLKGEGYVVGAPGHAGLALEVTDIRNVDTGQSAAELTVILQGNANEKFTVGDLEQMLPDHIRSELDLTGYDDLEITYHLEQPVETVMQTIQIGQSIDLAPILENSTIVVKGTRGTPFSIEGEVSAGILLEFGGKLDVAAGRYSTQVLYSAGSALDDGRGSSQAG